jgi:deazaflavin-dependent oxidoreductase (nitroreductase family)
MRDNGIIQPASQGDERLRQIFKSFNILMVGMWRLGLGRWINAFPDLSGRIMVISHTGRRSGRVFRTPVNFARVDGDLYCTAGFGSGSDWYRNLLVNPQVEIWLPGDRWLGIAEDVSNHARRHELLRQVIRASGLAAPLMGLDLRRISDAEFERETSQYRLIRIRRAAHLVGPGGQSDLAWIWVVTAILLLLAFLARREEALTGDRETGGKPCVR